MSQRLRILHRALLIIVASYPAAWLLAVFLFTLRASLFLGYWPEPSHPDPKSLPFELSHYLLFVGFLMLIPSMVVFLLVFWGSRCENRESAKRVYICGWIGIAVFLLLPKFNFVTWFLD
jgi:hypothetical protein